MLFDSHAHYDNERFDGDRDALLAQMPGRRVGYILNVGCDLASSEASAALAGRYPFIWAAAGIHPHCADAAPDDFETAFLPLFQLEKVVAVGEIGLDYHYNFSAPQRQQEVFARMLVLAGKVRKPVVIHDREADTDTMAILRAHRGVFPGGVFHCYAGGMQMLDAVLELGFYVAIGGTATFKNAHELREVAAAVPIDRLLIETDCPYLTPEPFRRQRNDSSKVALIADRVAQIRGIPVEQLENATCENAKKLFGMNAEGGARC